LPPPEKPATSRLAVAALICAVLGIPFFGAVTGLVAILLGSLALGEISKTHRKGSGLAAAGVILGLVDVVAWIVFLYYAFSRPGPDLQLSQFRPDLTTLKNLDPKIDRAMRANVLIQNRVFLGTALGSGVILKLDDDGAVILTNRHVIDPNFADGAKQKNADAGKNLITVQMIDEEPQPGRVIWDAPDGIDLSLVRVHSRSRQVRAARWKVGRALNVGDTVFAIGNPHGLGWTHTQGSVSQFRLRNVGPRQLRIIQTQTSINAGNSGGGLYDKDGYLIGINTWTEDKRVSEGLNFAITLDSFQSLSPPGLNFQAGSEDPASP
jgi:S1-C subfamily serine protease